MEITRNKGSDFVSQWRRHHANRVCNVIKVISFLFILYMRQKLIKSFFVKHIIVLRYMQCCTTDFFPFIIRKFYETVS